MKVKQAVKYFGSQTELARALNLTDAAVSRWVSRGGIVPIRHIVRLKEMSNGELDLRLEDYR